MFEAIIKKIEKAKVEKTSLEDILKFREEIDAALEEQIEEHLKANDALFALEVKVNDSEAKILEEEIIKESKKK